MHTLTCANTQLSTKLSGLKGVQWAPYRAEACPMALHAKTMSCMS